MKNVLLLSIAFTMLISISMYPLGTVFAASDDLTVAGWIPYWRDSEGIKDAKKHLENIDTVYPFAYSVQSDGSIKDLAGLSAKDWRTFIKTARKNGTEIIPTVMWSDGASTHEVLSNRESRAHHVDVIVSMVERGDYDGVDIDYEAKKSETKEYFSAFLTELKDELGEDRILSCTLEARTPPESLYKVVPKDIKYVNDYEVIADVCDRVVLMAYDQQRADLLLNSEKVGAPYMPVADVDWVRKVLELALEDIPKNKVVLGIPTYGHHYTVTVAPDWYKGYTKIGALNVPDLLDVARTYKVTPTRNKAGEMSFSYLPKDSTIKLTSSLKIPKNTPKGNIVAARALAYANKTGKEVQFRIGWYSDALAIKDKIDLAEEYDIRGISLFKIDGEEDQKVWRMLE